MGKYNENINFNNNNNVISDLNFIKYSLFKLLKKIYQSV